MADITVIGHGVCPRCNGQTDIKLIQILPFPEEEISRTEESCPSCKSAVERDFSSSNATTAQSHAFEQEKLKERIERIVSELLDLEQTGKLHGEKVSVVIHGLSMSEIILVYEELSRREKRIEDGFEKSQDEILQNARADAEFGNLPPFMGDWYDNEISASCIAMQENISPFDRIRICLREVEIIK